MNKKLLFALYGLSLILIIFLIVYFVNTSSNIEIESKYELKDDSSVLSDSNSNSQNSNYYLDTVIANYIVDGEERKVFYYELLDFRKYFSEDVRGVIEDDNVLYLVLLEKLIREETKDMTITQNQIDDYLNFEASLSGVSVEEIINSLDEKTKDELILNSAKQHYFIHDRIADFKLNESTIKQYYNNYILNENEVYIWQIVASSKDINVAYDLLAKGSSFEDVYSLYENEFSKTGFHGKFNINQLDKSISNQISKLKPNEFSEPFQTPFDWVIIKYDYDLSFEQFKTEMYDDVNNNELMDYEIQIKNSLITKYGATFPSQINVDEFIQ